MVNLCPSRYKSGNDYELWNYCWYATEAERDDANKSGFAADMLGTKTEVSMYVNVRMMILPVVLMYFLIKVAAISKGLDVRQLLTWKSVMRKYY